MAKATTKLRKLRQMTEELARAYAELGWSFISWAGHYPNDKSAHFSSKVSAVDQPNEAGVSHDHQWHDALLQLHMAWFEINHPDHAITITKKRKV